MIGRMKKAVFRQTIKASDVQSIAGIVRSTGFFSKEELAIAKELAREKLKHKHTCSYRFVFAEEQNKVVGYSCYGRIPATKSSYDIYWIVVAKNHQGQGWGKALMSRTEKLIFKNGGKQAYVETSSRKQYKPTHHFYENCGYRRAAFLKNFYATGDSKIIYSKTLK
jgi:ribosomal protein S18 acetylase RimI-like enzyme